MISAEEVLKERQQDNMDFEELVAARLDYTMLIIVPLLASHKVMPE